MTSSLNELPENIRNAAESIKRSHQVVVLTGAGISTPSGIPDFRSPDIGLWTKFEPMEVASLSAFRYNPEKFFKWLHPLAVRLFSAQPNPAHIALAELQKLGVIHTIITQNIDGLHTHAGATDVLEVHGSLSTLTCINCFARVPSKSVIKEYIEDQKIPHCKICGGYLKPDIILYEEQLPYAIWNKAESASKTCDLMIVVGTSLEVMPSARLPMAALENGASIIMINNTETYIDVRAEIIIRADVADVLPKLADEVFNG
jgi:NAD-dependent deacetylase